MVLLKMLVAITLHKMGELLVMMMMMISPLREGSSLGGTAPPEPRLVPPRFRLVAAEFHPRRWLMIIFPSKESI